MEKKAHDATTEYLKTLTESGIDDIVVLRQDTMDKVFTKKRKQLVDEIAAHDVESVRDLARRTERDISIVSRDLNILADAEVVEFVEEGRAKRPVLAHSNIVAEPLVFSGKSLENAKLAE